MNRFLMAAFAFAAVVFAGCSDDEPGGKQNSITGSVVIGGEPVNAAAVLLTPGGGSSITGSDGEFSFGQLAPGEYEIKVYKNGCLPFNRQVTVEEGTPQRLVLTLSENTGNLEINKGFIDMGSNASNNLAAFTITNTSEHNIEWKVSNSAKWIEKIEPETGSLPANGSAAVTLTINRNRLSQNVKDNYTSIVISSTTAGNGSASELLVTAFGKGNGTNTVNDNSDLDYVIVGDLCVQTHNISTSAIGWASADRLCNNSRVGGFDDWRLPTLDELAMMYENRVVIGDFDTKNYYWSSEIYFDHYYYYMSMLSGKISNEHQDNARYQYARAVRKHVEPYTSYPNLGLMVLNYDLGRVDYYDAVTMCRNCREGGFSDWRLPTRDELVRLVVNQCMKNPSVSDYWTSTADNVGDHYCIDVIYGSSSAPSNRVQCGVRAVRSIE